MSTEVLPLTLQNSSGAMAVTAVASSAVLPGGEQDQLRIYNVGPNMVSVTVSNAAMDAQSTPVFPTAVTYPAATNGVGTVIAVGATEVFTVKSCGQLNAICPAAGTAVLYFGRGKGN